MLNCAKPKLSLVRVVTGVEVDIFVWVLTWTVGCVGGDLNENNTKPPLTKVKMKIDTVLGNILPKRCSDLSDGKNEKWPTPQETNSGWYGSFNNCQMAIPEIWATLWIRIQAEKGQPTKKLKKISAS